MARIDRPDSTGGGAGSGGRSPRPRGPRPKSTPTPTPKPPRTTSGIGDGNRDRVAPVYRMTAPIPKPTPKPSLPPVPPKSVTAKNPNPQPTLKPIKSTPLRTSNKPTPTDVALGKLGTPKTKGGKIVHSSGEQVRMQPKTKRGTPPELLKKPPVVKPIPKPIPRLLHGDDPHLPRIITYRPKKGND